MPNSCACSSRFVFVVVILWNWRLTLRIREHGNPQIARIAPRREPPYPARASLAMVSKSI